MNYSIEQVNEMVTYWTAQPESEQKEVVLSYWVKLAQKFVSYRRTVGMNHGPVTVENTGSEVKAAIKIVATFFKVPQKKKGENRQSQMMRLTGM